LAFDLNENDFGTFKSLLTAIKHAGFKVKLRKCTRGNQYQNCMNTAIDTQAMLLG